MPDNPGRAKRRKIALACEPCRERKARCDGGRPMCATCLRRSLKPEQCVYKGFDDNEKLLRERIRELEQACVENGIDTHTLRKSSWHGSNRTQLLANDESSPHGPLTHLDSPAYHNEPNPMNPTPSATSCAGVTAMGTIADDSGLANLSEISQDFYGGSSAASFLHETCRNMSLRSNQRVPAKRAVRDVQPSSQFRLASVAKFQLPPRSLADHLIECYFERVYYLYPFFDRPAFEHAYNSLWQSASVAANAPDSFRDLGIGSPMVGDSKTVVFHAALNAIFALGCPFSNLPASEKVTSAEVFFSRSKSHFGFDLLELHNIGVVQVLLLVAQALQGTSFPNRCWNAVGAAYRIALALGLHTDPPYSEGESHDKEIRRRTWHGCIILDMLVSMTFGRPNITAGLSSSQVKETTTLDMSFKDDHEKLKVAFLAPCARLSLVLNQILSQVYLSSPRRTGNGGSQSPPTSRDTIANLEKQLDIFENSLPFPLSWRISEGNGNSLGAGHRVLEMQRNVLHARFIYARLLLYRQLFTRAVASNTHKPQDTPSTDRSYAQQPLDVILQQSFETECAKRCIHSSVELIEHIHCTYKTKETGAWWWNGLYACTSGLILILSRSCPEMLCALSPEEFDESWNQCREVLEALGTMSASARASLDLLTRVHNYIQSQNAVHVRNKDDFPRGSTERPDVQGQTVDHTEIYDNINLYGMAPWDGTDVAGPFFYSWDILDGFSLGVEDGGVYEHGS